MKTRTAYMIRFDDGLYLAYHKKPCSLVGKSQQIFGRKVEFDKGRVYSTKRSASGAMRWLADPAAKIFEVYVSESIMLTTPVMEDVYA